MDIKHFYLLLTVMVHIFIMISCVFFIVSHSIFNYHNNYLDILVILTILSFLIFKKCILIDVYNYLADLGGKDDNIPLWAKDNFLRNFIKKILGVSVDETDYTQYRLDKLNNINPMVNVEDKEFMNTLFNHKIHYIASNIILIFVVINKYNLPQISPLIFYWVFNVFKL